MRGYRYLLALCNWRDIIRCRAVGYFGQDATKLCDVHAIVGLGLALHVVQYLLLVDHTDSGDAYGGHGTIVCSRRKLLQVTAVW